LLLPTLFSEKIMANRHRAQIHTLYPFEKSWFSCGDFARYPLWPLANDPQSFAPVNPEWTAFYRYDRKPIHNSATDNIQIGFYQVFVCRGEINVPVDHDKKILRAGDFFCNYFLDQEFSKLPCHDDTLLIVKRQQHIAHETYAPLIKMRTEHSYHNYPFLIPHADVSGLDLDVRSSYLLGSAFQAVATDRTIVTMLEYFHENTVAPSHYHPAPVWHEFIYLQGGHMTPDGFYAPGDHIVSFPNCKEGPWLSTSTNQRDYPKEWPLYVERSWLSRPFQEPWPRIFSGAKNDIYGVLFVHYGPFVKINPFIFSLANWTVLDAHELGPEG